MWSIGFSLFTDKRLATFFAIGLVTFDSIGSPSGGVGSVIPYFADGNSSSYAEMSGYAYNNITATCVATPPTPMGGYTTAVVINWESYLDGAFDLSGRGSRSGYKIVPPVGNGVVPAVRFGFGFDFNDIVFLLLH